MKRSMLRSLATLAGLLALALPVMAADGSAAIKYRQAVMKAQAAHMAALSFLIKGEVDYKGQAVGHVAAIMATANMVRDLFPAGSDQGDTEALPAIWQKPGEFRRAVGALETSAAELGAAERAGDRNAVRSAFVDVGKACRGCHESFRKKKR